MPKRTSTKQEVIEQVAPIIGRLRLDIDRLESILYALVDEHDVLDAVLNDHGGLTMTRGGSLRHLGGSIREHLAVADGPLTSEEIAKALYSPSTGITYDLFKRRVIVTISAMFKKRSGDPEIVPAEEVGKGKEKRWVLARKHEDRPEAVLHDGQTE